MQHHRDVAYLQRTSRAAIVFARMATLRIIIYATFFPLIS